MPEREDLSGFLYLHVSCPCTFIITIYIPYCTAQLRKVQGENEGLLLEF